MNTEILYIKDKSHSMRPLRQAVIDGYNAFLAEQKAVPGEARMTQVQFSYASDYKLLCQGQPLAEAKPLTEHDYDPAGNTALRDAIGRTLDVQGKRIAEEKWAEQVIVCIHTDGQENDSNEYTQEQVKSMIEHAQGHGWKFVFLAANQDAFVTGASYGISGAHTRNFEASASGMSQAYGATSAMVANLRSTPTP